MATSSKHNDGALIKAAPRLIPEKPVSLAGLVQLQIPRGVEGTRMGKPKFLPPERVVELFAKDVAIDWGRVRELNVMRISDLCALSIGKHPATIEVILETVSHYRAADVKDLAGGLDELSAWVMYENEDLNKTERRISVAVNHLPPFGELPCPILPTEGRETAVKVTDFGAWAIGMGWELPPKFPRPAVAPAGLTNPDAKDGAPAEADTPQGAPADDVPTLLADARAIADETLAALFDPVTVAALEKMFPAEGKWKNWTERAHRNGLEGARQGRAMFNPYRAALWFLAQGVAGWDLARCNRKLANNLPARSQDKTYLLICDPD